MLHAVERRKISDVVADRLREHIAEERLKPGDRLPTEHALAEQLGVSRVSVREAIRALVVLGLLDSRPGRGLTVASADFRRLSDCLRYHPGLGSAPGAELIDTRVILETGVLPRVATLMAEDPAVFSRLDRCNAELRAARTLTRFIDRDIAFHRLLVESSGLSPMLAFSDLLEVFFRRFRESVKAAEWKAGVEGHRRIIESLREGEVVLASALLKGHIECHRPRH